MGVLPRTGELVAELTLEGLLGDPCRKERLKVWAEQWCGAGMEGGLSKGSGHGQEGAAPSLGPERRLQVARIIMSPCFSHFIKQIHSIFILVLTPRHYSGADP